MFHSLEILEKALRESDLHEEVIALVKTHVERAFVFKSEPGISPPLRSRLGGTPHLPKDAPWPTRSAYSDASRRAKAHLKVVERYNQKPPSYMKPEACQRIAKRSEALAKRVACSAALNFVAQIFLADLTEKSTHRERLPATGTLSLFYDFGEMPWGVHNSDQQGFALVYHENEGESRSNDSLFSDELESQPAVLPALNLNPQRCFVLPDLHALCWRAEANSTLNANDLERYHAFTHTHSMGDAEGDARDHRLLTWPASIQDDMVTRAWLNARGDAFRVLCDDEREEVAEEIKEWVCVMQIGSDEKADLSWVDDGQLYVFMTKDALKRRAFDEAFFSLQTH